MIDLTTIVLLSWGMMSNGYFPPAQQSPHAPTSLVASATSSTERRFVGTYKQTRPGADSTQELTLVLKPNQTCRFITSFPGYTATPAGFCQ